MKKLITILLTACVALAAAHAMPAYAAEPEDGGGADDPSNVTITVVMPEPAPAAADGDATEATGPYSEPTPTPAAPAQSGGPVTAAPAPITAYPSGVAEIRDGSGWQIVKTYELADGEDPAGIPREPFERGGWAFTLTDITRAETSVAETREHTETVTLETETNELETILPLLPPTMEYRSEDGFVGILSLDVSSIAVETAGTRASSYTMSVTREYPHLSTNDTGLVPKTVTDRGATYSLAGVDWRAGNTVTVDYTALPEYYTAIATYTATGTSTRVTGYATTAEYTGTLAKLSQGRVIYTAYFLGEEILMPLEIMAAGIPDTAGGAAGGDGTEGPAEDDPGTEPTEETQENGTERKLNPAYLVIIPCIGIMAGGAYYFIKKRKGNTKNEEGNDTAPVAAVAGGDGGPGSGGGLPL